MPLTAAEIQLNPAFRKIIWDLKPASKGKCTVAKNRGGPFEIAYEIHGTGPVKIVWIVGLGGYKWFWQRQLKDFGHDRGEKYSCLIFDNRGWGESDRPVMRYTTPEMAKDIFELLEHVGWTGDRSIHVVGVSMGGFMAQEMAYLKPGTISSLSLISTAAQLKITFGYFEILQKTLSIQLRTIPKCIDTLISQMKTRLSEAWLSSPDDAGQPPTNDDHFAAQEVSKYIAQGFSRRGYACQAMAAACHRKSAKQLKRIGDEVGRERIQVVHGTSDNLITFPHVGVLMDRLGGEKSGVTKRVFEGRGHNLPVEVREQFRVLIEALIDKVEAMR